MTDLQQLGHRLEYVLLALGLLFLVVNLRVGRDLWAWWRRRTAARLTWLAPKPPFYAVNLAIGVMMGLILMATLLTVPRPDGTGLHAAVRAVVHAQGGAVFGEGMMLLYYGYLMPLSTRIGRGLYEDGVWTDSGFMAYGDIGGLSWKPGTAGTLVLASRLRAVARTLSVPGTRLGEVRRVLREKIGEHAIPMDEGPGLHLGSRDTRESV
ncbi:MAG: hypothetical protein R2712_21645 [Vicinamibacterales bacterium]